MRRAFLSALLLAAASAPAAATTHYLDLVNTAPDSIVAFSVAPAGSNRFRALPLGDQPLRGGGESATFAVRGQDCLVDLRAEFRGGRVLIQRNFNVCKYRSYHTGRYLRRDLETTVAATP